MGNDRPRYWFPLALLGFAQLVVVALSFGGIWSGGWFAYTQGDGRQFLTQNLYGIEMSREAALALDTTFSSLGRNDGWLVAVLAVYLCTVVFYAVRAWRAA